MGHIGTPLSPNPLLLLSYLYHPLPPFGTFGCCSKWAKLRVLQLRFDTQFCWPRSNHIRSVVALLQVSHKVLLAEQPVFLLLVWWMFFAAV